MELTVIDDHPTDPAAFERHDTRQVHVPLAGKVPHVLRAGFAEVFPQEDGTPTPASRVAELLSDVQTA